MPRSWTDEQRKQAGERMAAGRAAKKTQPQPEGVSRPAKPSVAERKKKQEADLAALNAGPQEEAIVGGEQSIPTPDPDRPETIPPNFFSGQVRRMEDHAPRPGFRRRYFNDDKGGSNIGYAIKSGWTFVNRKDSVLNAAVTPRNNDLGSRVRQHVGADEAGQPMYAYLMEKPEWLCKLHETGPDSREEYHRALERQIGAGTLGEKAGENRYSQGRPFQGQSTSLPPIQVATSLKVHR